MGVKFAQGKMREITQCRRVASVPSIRTGASMEDTVSAGMLFCPQVPELSVAVGRYGSMTGIID